ncbi:MAG: stage III sporulation protein AB [Lachnospiraceae bacterium]|nr:stage III sporulation protein AB [Lachnospiraceae bacterium]
MGSLSLGIRIALNMKGRIRELQEIERILSFLEGELRVRHSTIDEALSRVADKSGQPFRDWLYGLVQDIRAGSEQDSPLEYNSHIDLYNMWKKSLDNLHAVTCLSYKDLEQLQDVGKALGYLDIESQQMNLRRELEMVHAHVLSLDKDLGVRMKNAVVVCLLGGIMTVIALL